MNYEAIKTIDGHVRDDAYFVNVATVLDLLQEDLASRRRQRRRTGEVLQRTIALLQRTRDNLLYLQENYRIVRRRLPLVSSASSQRRGRSVIHRFL